jgi:hypothetical protein
MDGKAYGQENFTEPHDVVQLPSQGLYYKNKKKSVKVGFLTAADENLLANGARNGGEGLISQLIRTKLYEPDFRPEDLLDGDLETILIFLRNTSFGPEYKVKLIDPETGNYFDSVINLESLDFNKPSVEPDSEGLFTVTLPKTSAVVKLKLLTYGDTLELDKMANNYPSGLIPPRVTWRLMKQIASVNGETSNEVISKFVNTMPIMDSKFISSFIRDNEPRLNLDKEITAPSGKKVLTKVTFGAEFFRPFF